MIKRIGMVSSLVLTLVLACGCGDGESNEGRALISQLYCPDRGTAILFDSEVYCRYAPELENEDFTCPSNAPFRFSPKDLGSICSPEPAVTKTFIETMLRHWIPYEKEFESSVGSPIELEVPATLDFGRVGVDEIVMKEVEISIDRFADFDIRFGGSLGVSGSRLNLRRQSRAWILFERKSFTPIANARAILIAGGSSGDEYPIRREITIEWQPR